MSKIIGIIGAAGVAATNKLLELIENELTRKGAFRDSHHPELVVLYPTQVPSRSLFLEGLGPSFIPDYVNLAKKLKLFNVSKICMSCCTAHYAIDEIKCKVKIEFLDLIEEIAKRVRTLNVKNVGLIASNGCLKMRIFDKYFKNICPEVNIIYPDDTHQDLVTKGICNIKNKHRFDDIQSKEKPQNIFRTVSDFLKNSGAEKIISGCTDIKVDYDLADVDALEVLKEIILKESEVYAYK